MLQKKKKSIFFFTSCRETLRQNFSFEAKKMLQCSSSTRKAFTKEDALLARWNDWAFRKKELLFFGSWFQQQVRHNCSRQFTIEWAEIRRKNEKLIKTYIERQREGERESSNSSTKQRDRRAGRHRKESCIRVYPRFLMMMLLWPLMIHPA